MLSYYVIYSEIFRKVIQQTENEALSTKGKVDNKCIVLMKYSANLGLLKPQLTNNKMRSDKQRFGNTF